MARENLFRVMLASEDHWKAVSQYVTVVIKAKDEEERIRHAEERTG